MRLPLMAHGSLRRINGDDMNHDELLQVIDVYNDGKGDAFGNALRAVVELHKPTKSINGYVYCPLCRAQLYPCPTVEAVEKELN